MILNVLHLKCGDPSRDDYFTKKPDKDEDEDEEDEIEVKHRMLSKEVLLGAIETDAKLGIQIKGESKDKGKWFTRVEVQFSSSLRSMEILKLT